MRVLLNKHRRECYFSSLKRKSKLPWQELSSNLGVNGRTLRAWRSGEFTVPDSFFRKVENVYGIKTTTKVELLPRYWYIKEAGRKGGLSRYAKYGNFGTFDGRRKGGLNSIKSSKLKKTNFKLRKKIKIPRKSKRLAELMGILIGDGGISRFQVKVTLGLASDKDYAFYVESLFEKLFSVRVAIFKSKRGSTIELVVSSRALVEFLVKCGLPVGNKIRQGINIPRWVKTNPSWSKNCLRGIFDTDGSVYLDQHKGAARLYKNINVAFTSASPKLLLTINEILMREGLKPTATSRRSIRLRREKDVINFFKVVGSSNIKHRDRFRRFLQRRSTQEA